MHRLTEAYLVKTVISSLTNLNGSIKSHLLCYAFISLGILMPKLIKKLQTLLFCKDNHGLLNVKPNKLLFYSRTSCYSNKAESKLNTYSLKFDA